MRTIPHRKKSSQSKSPVFNRCLLAVRVLPLLANDVLAILRAHPLGREAARIGAVTGEHKGMLVARTAMGANRVISIPVGEQLPRIC